MLQYIRLRMSRSAIANARKASAAKATLDSLKRTVPALSESLESAEKTLADARAASHKATSAYASALAEGGPELASMLEDLSKRIAKAAGQISAGQSAIASAEAKAARALEQCETIVASLLKLDPDSKELAGLQAQHAKLEEALAAFEEANATLDEAATSADETVSSLSAEFDESVKDMKKRNDTFNRETLPAIDGGLDAAAHWKGPFPTSRGKLIR